LVGGNREWQVTLGWRELRDIATSGPLNATELVDRLAMARRVNHRTLKKRSRLFVGACSLLLLQLLLWAWVFFERTW